MSLFWLLFFGIITLASFTFGNPIKSPSITQMIDPLEDFNLEDVAEIRKLETKSIFNAPKRSSPRTRGKHNSIEKCEDGEVQMMGHCVKYTTSGFRMEENMLINKFKEMLKRRKKQRREHNKRRG